MVSLFQILIRGGKSHLGACRQSINGQPVNCVAGDPGRNAKAISDGLPVRHSISNVANFEP